MPGPLEGLSVVDFTSGTAGPHATQLLAAYGASVTKVEPPGGDRARQEGPFAGPRDPEASAPFLALNGAKRSVVADLESPGGRSLARSLVERADLVVEDLPPGELTAHGIDAEEARQRRPHLVVCSVTPFGQTGPYAQLRASDMILQAMGGAMYATGHAEREPLRLAGHYAEWQAGLVAAFASMLAIYRAERTGAGDHVDVSIYETQAGGKDRRQLNLLAHAYSGAIAARRETAFALCSGVRPTRDGQINLLGFQRLPELMRLVGRDDLATRPELARPSEVPAALAEEIEAAYLAWTAARPMREALALAQQHRILGGTVLSIGDVLEEPTFRERGFWDEIEHPAAGRLTYPGRPIVMSGSPRPPAGRAPLLGEHTGQVGREVTASAGPAPALSPSAGEPQLPLEGVRVLDLGVVWAGPFASQLMAEWGAEVLKMEPVTMVQPQTRATAGARAGWFPDGDPGEDPWNRGVSFNSSGCDKRSFTGDLRTPEGREAFEQLIAISDVVVENNVPETADRLGLSYEDLAAINPGIIVVRMPGFGLTGPYRDYRCWGNHLEAMAGHLAVRAYPDMTPDAAGETYACDSIAGLTAALGSVMALRHRERTGRGQLVEVPQIEAFAPLMATELLDYQMTGVEAQGVANDHRSHAPHGAYRCAGSDRWIAIDVATDGEWLSLCRVLAASDLAGDPRFVTAADRWLNRRELDRELAGYTGVEDRDTLWRELQDAGVTAGPVQDDGDCFRCPQLRDRGFFEPIKRDDIGTHDYPDRIFRLENTQHRPRRAPPRLGEDNEYVYRDLLGYDDERYGALVESGQVGTTYAPAARLAASGDVAPSE
ncbi:MAG: CoA transferase [Dehalococcoidia bacterium]|nr:CoA transferase [Dehalococcoidia bacterium]